LDRTAGRGQGIKCFSPHFPDGVGVEASRVMNSALRENEVFLLRPNGLGISRQEGGKKEGKQDDRNHPAPLGI